MDATSLGAITDGFTHTHSRTEEFQYYVSPTVGANRCPLLRPRWKDKVVLHNKENERKTSIASKPKHTTTTSTLLHFSTISVRSLSSLQFILLQQNTGSAYRTEVRNVQSVISVFRYSALPLCLLLRSP